jgi:hypothetical protein
MADQQGGNEHRAAIIGKDDDARSSGSNGDVIHRWHPQLSPAGGVDRKRHKWTSGNELTQMFDHYETLVQKITAASLPNQHGDRQVCECLDQR